MSKIALPLPLHRVIAAVVTAFLMVTGSIGGVNHWDTTESYIQRVEAIDLYENTLETAVPQTDVYRIVHEHFQSELPEGKTAKKAIVIGYDGCRADTLSLAENADDSAILTLKNAGGHAYLHYCGGVPYPYINTQATSTAPGWCSMMTGAWADVHGITKNGQPKSNDHLTMLTTLVQSGTIASSAFYVSWSGHFGKESATYWPEKQYVEQNSIAAKFLSASDDAGTLENVLTDLHQADCTDFIFSILEYTDHEGHSSGFGLQNKKYAAAFRDAETAGKAILDAIAARETYETEDWLILITTDHGGYNLNHGRCTIHERYTFLVSNKDVAAKIA